MKQSTLDSIILSSRHYHDDESHLVMFRCPSCQSFAKRRLTITTFVPLVVMTLVMMQFYHFWRLNRQIRDLKSEESESLMIESIEHHIQQPHINKSSNSSTTLQTFPPLSKLSKRNSFGACLMVKGDNDFLTEWLPYHFTILPLRYLLIASDSNNTEDPRHVLDRWNVSNTGLHYKIVNISDLETITHNAFQVDPIRDLNRFNRGLKKKRLPPINSTDDLLFQRDVAHHHLMHKQLVLISYCTKYMKELGVQWVTFHDTDEFMVINRNEGSIDLMGNANATVVDILQSNPQPDTTSKGECYVLPRVTVGAMENYTCLGSKNIIRFATDKFDKLEVFNTLRFQQHADKNDFSKNRFGKAFLNINSLSQKELEMKPNNIHRPFPISCPRPVAQVSESPFYLMHYVGGWERFRAKRDIRRGFAEWQERAMIADSTSCCAQQVFRWLPQFVHQVGLQRAQYLLGTTAT
jgi:hypothetical protein